MKFLKSNNNRKTIKQKALEEPKGILAKTLLCVLVVCSLINLFIITLFNVLNYNYENVLLNSAITALNLILFSPLILGYINLFLMNSKDEIIVFSDLFQKPKRAFKYTFVFSLLLIVYLFITNIIRLIPFAGGIINLIISVYILPVFIFLPFVYLENENLKTKEIISKTFKLLEGRKSEFYGMLFSFIPYLILGLFTFGILYLWIIPYILISFSYQYLNWNLEREDQRISNLSNEGIIIITVLSFIVLLTISFVNIPSSFRDFTNHLLNYNLITLKGDSTLEYSGAVVTFDKPKNYKIAYQSNTTKTYINEENYNVVQYTIYMANEEDIIKLDKESGNKKTNEEYFTITINDKKLKGYKYTVEKDSKKEDNITVYYPKGSFIVTITLSNNSKSLAKKDIKNFITIY